MALDRSPKKKLIIKKRLEKSENLYTHIHSLTHEFTRESFRWQINTKAIKSLLL